MKSISLILILTCLSWSTSACLNMYNVNEEGEEFEIYRGFPTFQRVFDRAVAAAYIENIDFSDYSTVNYQTLSDVGVRLARLGEYERSLEIFQWLHKNHPEEYQIVSNLGTLYELNGEVDSAYKYIEKGMQLNPNSHYGSEWVHLSILHAKQQMAIDPNWIYNHKVLNMAAGSEILRDYDLDLYRKALNAEDELEPKIEAMVLVEGVVHQLKERIPFTPYNDIILANVLAELGDVLRKEISIEYAYVSYRMAEYYDSTDAFGVHEDYQNLIPLMERYDFELSVFEKCFPSVNLDSALSWGDSTSVNLEPEPEKVSVTQEYEEDSAEGSYWAYIIGGLVLLLGWILLTRRNAKR